MGDVHEKAARREQALCAVYEAHPERFVAGPPRVRLPPQRVLLNPADDAMPLSAERLLASAGDELLASPREPPRAPAPVIHVPGTQTPSPRQPIST